jgi:hypothetical protein
MRFGRLGAMWGPDARGTRQWVSVASACCGFGPLSSPMGQIPIRVWVKLRNEGRQVQAESPHHLFDQRLLGVTLVGNGGPQLLAIHGPTSSTDPMSGSCEVRPCPPERRCSKFRGRQKPAARQVLGPLRWWCGAVVRVRYKHFVNLGERASVSH